MMISYEQEIRNKNEVIRSQKECLLSIVDSRKIEREQAKKVREELEVVKEKLHKAEVDLCYKTACINCFKHKYPDLFKC
jgi:hypothetical protein